MEITKSMVDRAGNKLRQEPNDENPLNTLAAWRSRHVYPLSLAFNLLKRYTDKIGNKALYGQRLKRVNSIIAKLKRMPKSNLSHLNDIGGCRVILSDYNKLRNLYLKLQKSASIMPMHKDYITYPKEDGYRSIHLIYQCHSKKTEFNSLKIEFQLRTKLQHAWATTVEIIDLFESEKLKSGKGNMDWTRFFYLVADEFAKLEKLPVHDNSIIDRITEIKQLNHKLNIKHKLQSYSTITDLPYLNTRVVDGSGKATGKHVKISGNYFVMLLEIIDSNNSQINIKPFHDASQAQEHYINLEEKYLNDPLKNVLLVKMFSIKQIKKAYPNYFADSKIFLEHLNRILT